MPDTRKNTSRYSLSLFQGRKRREKERKGEKKGRRRKGKEGKREYADSVGGCVGRFFFQSPEVCQKLGRQPEFLATGDFLLHLMHRTQQRLLSFQKVRKKISAMSETMSETPFVPAPNRSLNRKNVGLWTFFSFFFSTRRLSTSMQAGEGMIVDRSILRGMASVL